MGGVGGKCGEYLVPGELQELNCGRWWLAGVTEMQISAEAELLLLGGCLTALWERGKQSMSAVSAVTPKATSGCAHISFFN